MLFLLPLFQWNFFIKIKNNSKSCLILFQLEIKLSRNSNQNLDAIICNNKQFVFYQVSNLINGYYIHI